MHQPLENPNITLKSAKSAETKSEDEKSSDGDEGMDIDDAKKLDPLRTFLFQTMKKKKTRPMAIHPTTMMRKWTTPRLKTTMGKAMTISILPKEATKTKQTKWKNRNAIVQDVLCTRLYLFM